MSAPTQPAPATDREPDAPASRPARIAASPLPIPQCVPTGRWKGRSAAPIAAALTRMFGPCGEGFGILMYHRVADVADATWNVTPDRFERQLAGLLERGWRPLPLSEVLARRRDGRRVPRSSFVVTFDDGYANNLTEALPVLRRLGLPATVFVATAYLDDDGPFPNDDWPRAGAADVPRSAWRPMNNDECGELAADPLIELGCHTHTHADFRGRPEVLYHDLMLNQAVLDERFGVSDPAFAFPYGTVATGFVSDDLIAAARRAGVTCALTTEDELASGDPFGWGRFTAEGHDTAETLAGKLGGWYTRLKHCLSRSRAAGPTA